jgi:hypothetical protein
MAQSLTVQDTVQTVEELQAERRVAIDKLVRAVYDGTEPPVKLREEAEHYARLTTMHLLDGSLENARRSADLWQRATSQLREFFASEEFAKRAGVVKELHRPAEAVAPHEVIEP